MKYAPRPSAELWDKLRPLARELRTNPTPAEEALWQYLRAKHIRGLRFRRQHVFERFIVDFYCPTAQLVIEVDGEIHGRQREHDAIRTEYLQTLGLSVIRFTNERVLTDIHGVLRDIEEAAQAPPPSPSPLHKVE